jgi:hypothetical protein
VRRLLSFLGVVLVLTAAGVAPVAANARAVNAAGAPGRILGIVPVLERAKPARPTRSSNLTYHNGPVMLTGNRTYTIFWAGANTPDWGPDGKYISTIQGYFANVATDSGKPSNVYATDTQYYDSSTANIAYASTVGDTITDTNPYPANGCTDRATTICLSDAQLQSELMSVMAAKGWPATSGGVQNLFFLFTPKGVGSCVGSSCAYTNYCAYHSWIGSGSSAILYANQPYAAQNYHIYTCDSGQHPNGTTADATLNVASHEHNEAITDEQGSAWFDSQGAENGDKCAWNFGTALGNTGAGQYNQVIGTGKYYLQQEWSNASTGCKLTYP